MDSGFSRRPQSSLSREWRAEKHQKALSQDSSCKGVGTQTQAKAVGKESGMQKAVWAGKVFEDSRRLPRVGFIVATRLGGTWALGGPTWSFLTSSHFWLPSPSPRRSPHSEYPTQEIKPSSAQKAPKWGWVMLRRETERKGVARMPASSSGQKQGPGMGRGSIEFSWFSVRSLPGSRLAPSPASYHC